LLNVLESDDGRAVAVHHNCAKCNGERLDVLCGIVFELENGTIIIGREQPPISGLFASILKPDTEEIRSFARFAPNFLCRPFS
jgi:hypothetical protein